MLYNPLWRHHLNVNRPNYARCWCVQIVFSIVNYGLIMSYEIQINTCTVAVNCLCVHSRFIVLFSSLRSSEGNKYQNNPVVSVYTVRHWNPCIIPYANWSPWVSFFHQFIGCPAHCFYQAFIIPTKLSRYTPKHRLATGHKWSIPSKKVNQV